ncbi:MAG: hypothetical protein NTY81_01715 [Candidatus Staskawiczbacteria bacterium]|nr:hypothetical protein [Candidatus Staskawiczbacteria bacterium]
MQVEMENYMEQVEDGICYVGYMKIGIIKVDYELRFNISIPQIPQMAGEDTTADPAEMRRIFQLTLMKKGINIDLTDHEFKFFSVIAQIAVRFYYDPWVRDNNDMRRIMEPEGLAKFGSLPILSMTRKGICILQPEYCEILKSKKFSHTLSICPN